MRESSSNTWRYGGILATLEWKADAGKIRRFYGDTEGVHRGDRIRVLHTGSGMHFVDVVRA